VNAYRRFFQDHQKPRPEDITLEASPAAMLDTFITEARGLGLPPLYVVIDEYDNFTNQLIQAHQDSCYYDATGRDSFLKNFFKTLKLAIQRGTVADCFLTGVLPVTMDDLTSGFNIASNVTLEPALQEMLGFTEAEAESYVDEIFRDCAFPAEMRTRVLDDLARLYDGYRILPDSPHRLYNPTISNYYLQKFVQHGGVPPQFTSDPNITLDLGWIERLAGSSEAAAEFIRKLLLDGETALPAESLQAQFNLKRFLTIDNLPVSLYFLGQLTWRDNATLRFPNLTVQTLFLDCYTQMTPLGDSTGLFRDSVMRFSADGDLERLFADYWKHYIQAFPAQSFDHVPESFYSLTFYYLCRQNLPAGSYPATETNLPSGRCDFHCLGVRGKLLGQTVLVEFKRLKSKEAFPDSPEHHGSASDSDAAQTRRYSAALAEQFHRPVLSWVAYVRSNRDYRLFSLV